MSPYEMRHTVKKLASTLRIVTRLALARTFGRYEHSVHDGTMSYAVYHWRGYRWAVPTSPLRTAHD